MKEKAEQEQQADSPPALKWDVGTAYDFFISLTVLHEPEEFGLRASWAAGVRSRLPAAERRFLETVLPFTKPPFHWIYSLSQPKDATSALYALRQLPPAERISSLQSTPEDDPKLVEIFQQVKEAKRWQPEDLEQLRNAVRKMHHKLKTKDLQNMLDWWSRSEEYGERYFAAMQSYYQVFFAEEEKRLAPFLNQALQQAQELAGRLSLHDLLLELSQGVHFEESYNTKKLILVPVYWSSPLVFFAMADTKEQMLMYGARPATASLVPGEQVPEGLMRALKALADPSRLKIMRYLCGEPLTQAELSRRLRLRPPTVIHHLRDLRVAGLVQIRLDEKETKAYTLREEAIDNMVAELKNYLQSAVGE